MIVSVLDVRKVMDGADQELPPTCTVSQNGCSLLPSETGDEDTIAVLRMIASALSLLGSISVIFAVLARRQLKRAKVHPIFALAVSDVFLSVLWFLGGAAWLSKLDNRALCFAISLPTVILECVTVNLILVYAFIAYSGIKNKNPETLLLNRPDDEAVDKVWSRRATMTAYIIALALPTLLLLSLFIIILLCSNYVLVTETDTCSCWCMPTLGNVLPRAIPIDKATVNYIRYVAILEATYGVVVGTHYLVVFILLLVVYRKVLVSINQLKKHYEDRLRLFSVVQLIDKGRTKAKHSVISFLTIFLISGLCNFTLSYTIAGLVIHLFATKGVHVVSLDDYHKMRTRDKHQSLLVLLQLQSVTVPLQGFLNAIVYAWTREDFLRVMGIQSTGQTNDIDETVTFDYDDVEVSNKEDMERSRERSYRRAFQEGSASMSTKSDCLSNAYYKSERKESIASAADYLREQSQYSSDCGTYNTY